MNQIIVSILTFNKLEYTKRCIETLFKTNTKLSYRIVVSDNGSSDDTCVFLRSLPNILLIENKENLGFSKAHNKVMNMFNVNDVILLNNDIEVPENWLDAMYNRIHEKQLGAVSLAIKTKNGLDVGAILDKNAKGRSLINSNQTPDWITGSCIYINRGVINKIGGLSEDYYFYYEDVDYCFKMKQAGIKFECIKDVSIIHHDSVSSNPQTKKQMMEQSRQVFAKKWGYNV